MNHFLGISTGEASLHSCRKSYFCKLISPEGPYIHEQRFLNRHISQKYDWCNRHMYWFDSIIIRIEFRTMCRDNKRVQD